MSKEKEVSIDYKKIPLQDEVCRIIITQSTDGTITTLTKGKERNMSLIEAVGLLETAKTEALLAARQSTMQQQVDPALLEEVEITLDEMDLEMDVDGLMKQAGLLDEDGKVISTPIKVSRYAAKMREKRRDDFLKQKNS